MSLIDATTIEEALLWEHGAKSCLFLIKVRLINIAVRDAAITVSRSQLFLIVWSSKSAATMYIFALVR